MRYIFIFLFFFLFPAGCSSHVEFSFDSEAAELRSEYDDSEPEDYSEECFDCSDGFVHEFFEFKATQTELDILFVLDVSESMRDNLSKLGESMDSLLSRINVFDWQMAFTTADHGDHTKVRGRVGQESWKKYNGTLPHFGQFMQLELDRKLLRTQFLNKDQEQFEKVFKETLTLNSTRKDCNNNLPPFCQGGHEQPLRSLKAALERPENQGFFRSKADFISIILTNEDERVEDPDNATTAEEVKRTFHSLHNPSQNKNYYNFGIIVNNEDCYNKHNEGSRRGEYSARVAKLAEITNGRNISICNEDYGRALRGVSNLIRERSFDRVKLKNYPQPETVQVSFTPASQEVEWMVRGNTIYFEKPLDINAQVDVEYITQ